MNRKWIYVSNVFLNTTRSSFKKMYTLIIDHVSRLTAGSANPDIMALLTRIQAYKDRFVTAWENWMNAKGHWQGETQRFEEKMTELTDLKVKQWDATVRGVHLEGSSDYKIIFPDGRSGFRNGTYESRISRVGTLAKALGDYGVLSALKAEVDHYYTDLAQTRKIQQDKEGEVKLASDALEACRIDCGEQMFSNLGFLMYKLYKTPDHIESYFDLSLLRSTKSEEEGTEPEIITGTVEANSRVTILQGGFDANTQWHIVNTGSTSLQFYTAMLPTDPVPGSPFELLPSEEADVFASELGADGNLFLIVFNPDTALQGEYSLMNSEEAE